MFPPKSFAFTYYIVGKGQMTSKLELKIKNNQKLLTSYVRFLAIKKILNIQELKIAKVCSVWYNLLLRFYFERGAYDDRKTDREYL